MAADTPTVTIHMVSSLDGFIAKKDGSISWFESSSHYEKGAAEEDPVEFLKTIGCFIMGANTYEQALTLGWPYGDVPTIVVTHRNLPATRETVEFYSGDLTKLVNDRLKPKYKNIWLVGGAMLVKEFIHLRLGDDIRLAILPVILGDGTPFLDGTGEEQGLALKDVTAYKNGLVELWYEIKKDNPHE